MSSKIEKKDLKTIYRRYLALNCMNDYPGQMHNGYTFSSYNQVFFIENSRFSNLSYLSE